MDKLSLSHWSLEGYESQAWTPLALSKLSLPMKKPGNPFASVTRLSSNHEIFMAFRLLRFYQSAFDPRQIT